MADEQQRARGDLEELSGPAPSSEARDVFPSMFHKALLDLLPDFLSQSLPALLVFFFF